MHKYMRVFVALDGSEEQDGIFWRAVRVALSNGATLILGQVVDMSKYDLASTYDPNLINQVLDYARDCLDDLADQARSKGVVSVETVVRYGPVRQTLLEEVIGTAQPDLIICGDRGLSRVEYALVGSVSNYLVHHASCDVLIVKDKTSDGLLD